MMHSINNVFIIEMIPDNVLMDIGNIWTLQAISIDII